MPSKVPQQGSHSNKLHTPHHRPFYPQHYPTINKGTKLLPSNSEGVDSRQDEAMDADAANLDVDTVKAPIPYVGRAQLVPYVQGVAQQGQRANHKMYTNKTKWYTNQNMCYMCGFDVEDWHTSTTCQCKKQVHQDSFTHANYMQYA